jgi:hypothetical protein
MMLIKVRIGRSSRIFPPSERSVRLSPHYAQAEYLILKGLATFSGIMATRHRMFTNNLITFFSIFYCYLFRIFQPKLQYSFIWTGSTIYLSLHPFGWIFGFIVNLPYLLAHPLGWIKIYIYTFYSSPWVEHVLPKAVATRRWIKTSFQRMVRKKEIITFIHSFSNTFLYFATVIRVQAPWRRLTVGTF